MNRFYQFLDSEAFGHIFFACVYLLIALAVLNILSIVIRGIATATLTEKAGLLGKAKGFFPYARNSHLCRISEKMYQKKTGENCAEYSKYCATLQAGNICADVCAAVLAVLAFAMYVKADYTATSSVVFVVISASVCALFRMIFGIANRAVIARAIGLIREYETGKKNGFFNVICLFAPVADISALVISRK